MMHHVTAFGSVVRKGKIILCPKPHTLPIPLANRWLYRWPNCARIPWLYRWLYRWPHCVRIPLAIPLAILLDLRPGRKSCAGQAYVDSVHPESWV